MNLHNMHILPAMLMLSICSAAAGQNKPPESNEEWPVVHSPGCRISKFPLPGLSTYVDKVDGFQFKYPSALKTDDSSLQFENWTCVEFLHSGEFIRLEVSLPPAYQEPIFNLDKDASVEAQVFNQLKWMNYSKPGGAEFCAWKSYEQVCIKGFDTSREHRVSNNLLRTMREIESTFIFTDFSERLDIRIAAVKVGDRFGNLRVRKVVTREMAERYPRGSYAGSYVSYGEIDFTGSVTMTGNLEDFRTMNSGPDWMFSPDSEISSLFSCDLCKDLSFQVQFKNDDFGIEQNDHIKSRRFGSIPYSYGADFSVVVNNISVIFSPGSFPSFVKADIVKIVNKH